MFRKNRPRHNPVHGRDPDPPTGTHGYIRKTGSPTYSLELWFEESIS